MLKQHDNNNVGDRSIKIKTRITNSNSTEELGIWELKQEMTLLM